MKSLLIKASNENHCFTLQKEALDAWKKLKQYCSNQGYDIKIISAYRDADYQRKLFLKTMMKTIA